MKIIAFAASNSSKSINLELVKSIANQFAEHDVEILDLNDFEMPIYSQDRNNIGIPELALQFNEHIKNSDAIIIGLAEHNGTFTTAFKNIFDWGSRANMAFFQQKPMLAVATSPGPRGGLGVLESAKSIFPYFGGNIKGTYSLPNFFDNFKEGAISNTDLHNEVRTLVEQFKTELV